MMYVIAGVGAPDGVGQFCRDHSRQPECHIFAILAFFWLIRAQHHGLEGTVLQSPATWQEVGVERQGGEDSYRLYSLMS